MIQMVIIGHPNLNTGDKLSITRFMVRENNKDNRTILQDNTIEEKRLKEYLVGEKESTSLDMKVVSIINRTLMAEVNKHFYAGRLWQKNKGTYEGDFMNGNKHGRGVFDFDSGLRYEG